MKIMETKGFTQILAKLGEAEEIHQSLIKEIESFVCMADQLWP